MTKEEAIRQLNTWGMSGYAVPVVAIQMAIEALSVVWCKECKHRYMDGDVTHYYWCRLHDRPVDDTDYCSWGERKGGEDE